MSRLRDALMRPVIFMAILTLQTTQVVSWPARARQAPPEGKSEAANPEKLLADGDSALVTLPTAKSWDPLTAISPDDMRPRPMRLISWLAAFDKAALET